MVPSGDGERVDSPELMVSSFSSISARVSALVAAGSTTCSSCLVESFGLAAGPCFMDSCIVIPRTVEEVEKSNSAAAHAPQSMFVNMGDSEIG